MNEFMVQYALKVLEPCKHRRIYCWEAGSVWGNKERTPWRCTLCGDEVEWEKQKGEK